MPSVADHPFDAYQGREPFIFISYSHRDGDVVFSEIHRLHQLGYRIWYDEGIDPGNEWTEQIANALENAAYFIVFISEDAALSKNVRNEINFALNHHKPFLAIHLTDVQLPKGLELRMADIQAIYKWQLPDEHYHRKLGRSLPEETKQPVDGANVSVVWQAPVRAAQKPPAKSAKAATDVLPPDPRRKSHALLIAGGVAVAVAIGCAAFFLARPHGAGTAPAGSPAASVAGAASPVAGVTPTTTAAATPAVAQNPATTPSPTPSSTQKGAAQNELLKKRIAEAEAFETANNWPAAIDAYARVATDFPESASAGTIPLITLLSAQRSAFEKMSAANFEPLLEPMAKAAHLGLAPAEMILAEQLRQKDPDAAFAWFCAAAAQGYAEAVTQVGLMYSNGWGIDPVDPTKPSHKEPLEAVTWFKWGNTLGEPAATTCLAECYLKGFGVGRDPEKAVTLLLSAADAGNLLAMDNLGDCYEKGTGTKQSIEEAMRWFRKAMARGYLDSQANLGILLYNNKSYASSPMEPFNLWTDGAGKGNAYCMFLLARWYENGLGADGVNKGQAEYWYTKAAEKNYKDAIVWCEKNGISITPNPSN